MLLEGIVSFKCRLMHVQILKKQKENSREGITWSEMGKQNVQAKKVYCTGLPLDDENGMSHLQTLLHVSLKNLDQLRAYL